VTAPAALELVPLDSLSLFPGNARRGNADAIRDSLRTNGQYRPLLVQTGTRRVVAGNNVLAVMREEGWAEAEVKWLDVDDATARRIVLADNRTSDLSGYDDAALSALLAEVGEDLSGTGYTPDDFSSLLASLTGPDAAVLTGGEERPPATPRVTPTSTEYEESYATRDSRFLALVYPAAVYEWITGKLEKIAADLEAADPAEAVLRLVENETGEQAPRREGDAA